MATNNRQNICMRAVKAHDDYAIVAIIITTTSGTIPYTKYIFTNLYMYSMHIFISLAIGL